MKSPSKERFRLKPIHAWVAALTILSVIMITSGVELFVSYKSAIQKASEQTRTTSYLITEWISASFAIPQNILKDIIGEISPEELKYPTDNPTQHSERTNLLVRKAKLDPTILFLGFLDSECIITHTSIGVNLGFNSKNREYCELAFQSPVEAFKTSKMFTSSTNQMNVTVSYPVITASHEMAGFALVGLDLSFFQHWLDRLNQTEGMVISVFDTKKQLLARKPVVEEFLGKQLDDPYLDKMVTLPDDSVMTFRTRSPYDGIDRVWTFRRVHDLPFIVVTGFSIKEVLALWWVKFAFYLAGNFILLVVIVFGVRAFNYSQKLAKSMEELACTDPLTGLANRRRFIEMMQFRIEEASRYEQTFSIVLIDIDYFKRVNDNYGHDAGDLVLQAFAKIIRGEARTNDTVARWGGEEFIVLLPNTDQNMSAEFGERLRMTVAKTPINTIINITISLGISEWRKNDTMDTLIKRADEALYCAKNKGRNRIEIAQ